MTVEEAREIVRRALSAADNANHAGELTVLLMASAGEMVDALMAIDRLDVMEINPSNYDHETVCELSRNAAYAATIVHDTLNRLEHVAPQ